MKPFPHLVLLVTAAAFIALPFSVAAGGMLLLVAGLAAIISADYSQRYRGLRLPRRTTHRRPANRPCRRTFRAAPLTGEPHRLAA